MMDHEVVEIARRAGVDRRTAKRWAEDPSSIRPTTRARIEKAATKADARPWLVDADTMTSLDQIVELMPRLVALSTTLAAENQKLRAEIAELRGEPSREQPKRKNGVTA